LASQEETIAAEALAKYGPVFELEFSDLRPFGLHLPEDNLGWGARPIYRLVSPSSIQLEELARSLEQLGLSVNGPTQVY